MKTGKMMTGLGIGAAAMGIAAASAGMMKPKMMKSAKKKAGKAMKQMSGIMNDVSYLFK